MGTNPIVAELSEVQPHKPVQLGGAIVLHEPIIHIPQKPVNIFPGAREVEDMSNCPMDCQEPAGRGVDIAIGTQKKSANKWKRESESVENGAFKRLDLVRVGLLIKELSEE